MATPPLDNPEYEPEHPPVDGKIPEVVESFGMRTQIRWFRRFAAKLYPVVGWENYYVSSEHHKGSCCSSCRGEFENDYGVILDGWCCCKDERIQDGIISHPS